MGTVGGKLGCAAAALITTVLSLPLLFGLAWSGAHCEPVPQCQQDSELYFGTMLAGVAAVAGITGFLVRWAINAVAGLRDDNGTSAAFVTAAAVAAVVIAGLMIIVAFAVLDRTVG